MTLAPGLTNVSVAPATVGERADQTHELLTASLVLQSAGGTLTASGSEQTLFIIDEPLGCFKPVVLHVDLDNMDTGDTTVLRVYYRLSDGGTLKVTNYNSYTGADGGLTNAKQVAIVLYANRHGIKITLEQTAGTNRDYPWEVFVEA